MTSPEFGPCVTSSGQWSKSAQGLLGQKRKQNKQTKQKTTFQDKTDRTQLEGGPVRHLMIMRW